MSSAIEAALERLEAGVDLPQEPSIHELYDRGKLTRRQWTRLYNAQSAITAKVNRDVCARFPVECTHCGKTFTRKRIDQKRCQECIDRAKPRRG